MCPLCEQLIVLFDEYRAVLGLEDDPSRTAEYQDKVANLICEMKGHDLGADHCGEPEHDFCYRCNRFAQELGYHRSPTWEQDYQYVKDV